LVRPSAFFPTLRFAIDQPFFFGLVFFGFAAALDFIFPTFRLL
jgi:hypothetical protein